MNKPMAWIAQALLYGLFAVIVGYFSSAPTYHHLGQNEALIKLSFSLHGKLLAQCRQRSEEELARLPPNMRAPLDCKRERSPVAVEVDLDGVPVLRHVSQPSGLSKDGASTVYHRFPVAAGAHTLAVRLNDDAAAGAPRYHREQAVRLAPGQVLVIDFNAEKGGITLI